jgi:hypothetical protein
MGLEFPGAARTEFLHSDFTLARKIVEGRGREDFGWRREKTQTRITDDLLSRPKSEEIVHT